MRIWIKNLPIPTYDANNIVGSNAYLLEQYAHKFVTRNNKIYFITDNGKFGFWINPKTKVTRIYKTADKKIEKIYYNNTMEKK